MGSSAPGAENLAGPTSNAARLPNHLSSLLHLILPYTLAPPSSNYFGLTCSVSVFVKSTNTFKMVQFSEETKVGPLTGTSHMLGVI